MRIGERAAGVNAGNLGRMAVHTCSVRSQIPPPARGYFRVCVSLTTSASMVCIPPPRRRIAARRVPELAMLPRVEGYGMCAG